MTTTLRGGVALLALLWIANAFAMAAEKAPSLVVLLVVDQFRADYVERFQHQWKSGLRRLLTDGAWFQQAEYPYFNTVTCPGHATVSTGVYPSTHGMILNAWWDRGSKKIVPCADDAEAMVVSYGKAASPGAESAARLKASTLGDELRMVRPSSRVAAFSLKARSAVTLAGQRANAVAWFQEQGVWVSSSRYGAGPVPAVADFITRHPIEERLGAVWNRALPVESYLHDDDSTLGVTTTTHKPGFPHMLGSEPDRAFYNRWQASPFSDEYVAQMALNVARQLELGRRDTTDLLAVGFSALDKIGHDFGPTSHEVQDVLVRLDRTLGDFFSALDRSVGVGNYTVALTADHGVAPIPERAAASGLDAGRTPARAIVQKIDETLTQAFGPGKYVAALTHFDAYLESGVMERVKATPSLAATLRAELRNIPGILTVYTRDEVQSGGASGDPMLRRLAYGHDPDRSGDLTLVPKRYWSIGGSSGALHGTGYEYDTRVPLFLMGKGIAPGRYADQASPADIAPTLARLAGVTLPRVDGRVLEEALARAGRQAATRAVDGHQ
jgi:predicted AlkP superfamily pyrophosphatase or phosphodiesterase